MIVRVIIVLAILNLIILFSGYRILLSETRVNPGDTHHVAGYGNLGDSGKASLVCRYFTGSDIKTDVFWYSPGNILGRDACPFIYRP